MIDLKNKLKNVPKLPGCYLWKNKHGIVIYVGKAKNLYNRTHQYFNNKKDPKTFKLVQEIFDLDYVIVNNENDSLLLENNLISKHKPKYNILLRETNTFPYIVLTNEKHPKLIYLHDNKKKVDGTYYGPFAIAKKYDLFNFINHLFPFRKCKNVPKQKCVYYDIGQCLGPCINKVEKKDYDEYIKKVNNFFNGKYKEIDELLEKKELEFANNLDFENSQKYLELRNNLVDFSKKQDIIFSKKNNIDVVGFAIKENVIALIIFKYVEGILLSKYEIITVFYNEVSEIIESLLFDYYKNMVVEKPKIVNLSLDDLVLSNLSNSLGIKFINPSKGIKKDVMINVFENANQLLKNKYLSLIANLNREIDSLQELSEMLKINNLYTIDLFDNSNIFNDNKVGVVVVYENGKKNKKLYRKFNIKNELANSDYEYMKEVIYRRYKNLLINKEALPNLIIVDGGKIQISAAISSLKLLNLDQIIPVIGLAKDDKHKTDRIIKADFSEIILDKKSNLFFFLLNMQDEVHRFAISFYRNKKSKSLFKNSLSDIKNLGNKRISKLIEKYQTIESIKNADIDELSQIVPKNVANAIKEKLK